MNTIFRTLTIMLSVFVLSTASLNAQRAIFVEETYADEDFDLSNSELPSWDIIPGGPGKDGIPALTHPDFVTVKHDKWMNDDDRVIGVTYNGVSKAYPVKMLNYHEVINDDFDGQAVAITYSPLCGSVMVYGTENQSSQWEMAVSGLLYNNNALYFDRETESLWSQVMGRAVAGPAAGEQLQLLPSTLTTWNEWQERYPETKLLASETGFSRNYDIDAYAHYGTTDRLMFPVNNMDDRLEIKARVLGVEVDGMSKAYPLAVLAQSEDGMITDEFNGQQVQIEYVKEAEAAYVTDGYGNALPSANMYWFSWASSHPDTEIHGLETILSMSLGMF